MASPVIGTPTSATQTSNVTSHPAAWPSLANGDMCLGLAHADGATTWTWPPGDSWTELFDYFAASGNQSAHSAAYMIADGTESGNTTPTTADAENSAVVLLPITGHEAPATQAPEYQLGESVTNSTTPDPPNISPTGGSKDYLFIASAGGDTGTPTLSAGITSYTQRFYDNPGTTGDGCWLGVFSRELTAASENPGTFTISAGRPYVSSTIVIHPSGGGGGGPATPQGLHGIGSGINVQRSSRLGGMLETKNSIVIPLDALAFPPYMIPKDKERQCEFLRA